MAARFKPLFLALVLIGTCWAGTEALSLSDFLSFGDASTDSSLQPKNESASDQTHNHKHHTSNEDDNHHSLGHDDAHQHHHTHVDTPEHPNTDNTGYRTNRFTFQDPLSLSQRREKNQWSSANEQPSKPRPNLTNIKMNHKHPQYHTHGSRPHPSSSTFNMPFPFINHHHKGEKHVHGYSRPYFSPHDLPSYHQRGPYHRARAHLPPHPYKHTHSYNHHHYGPHDHYEASVFPDFIYDRPSVYPPPPPPPPPMPKCPMLYTRVDNRCIAIFSIARMTWDDARLFCDGIFGELLTFDHLMDFYSIVSFLQEEGLSSSFWVGGRASRTGWYWVGKQRLMNLGTPFWAVREKSDSQQETFQAPATDITDHDKWCAAMNSRDYYYLSDAKCKEKKSPVCVLRQGAEVVVASRTTNYYPALDNSFELWNRKIGCLDDDDYSDNDSSEESSDEEDDEDEDEDEDDDMDENKGEEEDKGVEGINIDGEDNVAEEEVGGKKTEGGDKENEKGKEGKKEVDDKEVEVEGTIKSEEEIKVEKEAEEDQEDGSGMHGSGDGDDEDMVIRYDDSYLGWDAKAGMTPEEYGRVYSILVE